MAICYNQHMDTAVYLTFHQQRETRRREEREALRQSMLAKSRAAIRQLAPQFPAVTAVYLFGSIMQPGHFTQNSDIDVSVKVRDVAVETPFWRALEQALGWDVDVRPYTPPITDAVAWYGECVYARKSLDSTETN